MQGRGRLFDRKRPIIDFFPTLGRSPPEGFFLGGSVLLVAGHGNFGGQPAHAQQNRQYPTDLLHGNNLSKRSILRSNPLKGNRRAKSIRAMSFVIHLLECQRLTAETISFSPPPRCEKASFPAKRRRFFASAPNRFRCRDHIKTIIYYGLKADRDNPLETTSNNVCFDGKKRL